MTARNDGARDAALAVGVHAATDVTGFGLLGHLRELCVGSGVVGDRRGRPVPVIDGVATLLDGGHGGGRHPAEPRVRGRRRRLRDRSPSPSSSCLADAQTSGGLLLSVPADRADRLLDACRERGTLAASGIGSVGSYAGRAHASGSTTEEDDHGRSQGEVGRGRRAVRSAGPSAEGPVRRQRRVRRRRAGDR